MKEFLNLVLTVNSIFWFTSLGFLAYSFGTLISALDWRQFLFAAAIFTAVSLSEIIITALAHN